MHQGVSDKLYKQCDRLRHKLFLLLRDLWHENKIVEHWCKVEEIYLLKKAEAELITQFQLISILNVNGKLDMGILARRTVKYLQSNGYVDKSIQKAGNPGCVKHTFSIWDVIQDVKKNRKDLNVVWVDLANSYGSVPHELLMKAMNFFYIPQKIKDLM